MASVTVQPAFEGQDYKIFLESVGSDIGIMILPFGDTQTVELEPGLDYSVRAEVAISASAAGILLAQSPVVDRVTTVLSTDGVVDLTYLVRD